MRNQEHKNLRTQELKNSGIQEYRDIRVERVENGPTSEKCEPPIQGYVELNLRAESL